MITDPPIISPLDLIHKIMVEFNIPMKKTTLQFKLTYLSIILAMAGSASGVVRNWNGSGNWTTAANWSGGVLPGPADSVVFMGSSSCSLDVGATVQDINFFTYTGQFRFGPDTLSVLKSANFSGVTWSINANPLAALDFTGSLPRTFMPKMGDTMPTIIQTGTNITTVTAGGFTTKNLHIKNGTFNCGTANDTVLGALTLDATGTLELGSCFMRANTVSTFAGGLNFQNGQLTVYGSNNTNFALDTVYPGTGTLNLQQPSPWKMFTPPTAGQLPHINKQGADSLVINGTLHARCLNVTGGVWDWGSGGRAHVVDTIFTNGGCRMYFTNSGSDSVLVSGTLNLSGLAPAYSGGSVFGVGGNGAFVLNGPGPQTLSPLVDKIIGDIRHTGTGVMTLFGNLRCNSFTQNGGPLNINGFNIKAETNFTVLNGGSSTMLGLGGGDSIAASSATIKGVSGDPLNLNPSGTWKLYVCGPLGVDFATISNCLAGCSTGYANNSVDGGGNSNWKFGKFWKASAADSLWTSNYNWAPAGAPQPSDSVIFDNAASKGCFLNAPTTVRAIVLTNAFVKQFDFGVGNLTVLGAADLRSGGDIVPGNGAINLNGSGNQWFYPRMNDTLPPIFQIGIGTTIITGNGYFNSPKIYVNNGGLSIYTGFSADSVFVLNPGTLKFDNATYWNDTMKALSGTGNLDMGWANVIMNGDADLSGFNSVTIGSSSLKFIGSSTKTFLPKTNAVFNTIEQISGTTIVSYFGFSAYNLILTGGVFNCGMGLTDSIINQISGGSGTLNFGMATLKMAGLSIDLSGINFSPGFGTIVFCGMSAQTFTPKPSAMHPRIEKNSFGNLYIQVNALRTPIIKVNNGSLIMNTNFNADTVLVNSSGSLDLGTGAYADTVGVMSGSGTLSMNNAQIYAYSDVNFSALSSLTPGTGALNFMAAGPQTFSPKPFYVHPAVIHGGSGTLNQSAPLKCSSFMQTAGAYNINGFQDTITAGNFSITNGTSNSFLGLANSAIVVQTGNAGFSGAPGNLLNLNPGSPWRLDAASGNKTAQYATIAQCDASGGAAAVPANCAMGQGNVNWNAALVLPELFDTLGTKATIQALQRPDGSDTVDIYYQVRDPDNPVDTVKVFQRSGVSGAWQPFSNVAGDIGPVAANDSSIHRHVRWHGAGQMGTAFSSDSMQLKIIAIDAYSNRDSLTMASANLRVRTKAPQLSASMLTSPNGGEVWAAGSSHAITWNVAGITDNALLKNNPVSLDYSLDNGATFVNSMAAGYSNGGSFTWTTPLLTSAAVRVRISVIDSAGHTGFDMSDASFTIDASTPGSPTISIINRQKHTKSPLLSLGLSAQNADSMRFRIDANAWSAWEQYATIKNNMSIASGGQGNTYIFVEYKDRAGNTTLPVSDSTVYDTIAPSCSLTTQGTFGPATWPGAVSGISSDGLSGVQSVFVRIRNEATGGYWNSIAWGPDSLWITVSGKSVWNCSLATAAMPAALYTLTAFALDSAGNKSGLSIVSVSMLPGPLAPTISIVNNVRFTNSPMVGLILSAQNADSMHFRVNNDPWTSWELLQPSKMNFPIAAGGEGLKRVYVEYKDKAAQISAPVFDNVVYDTTAPRCTGATHGFFNPATWPGYLTGNAFDSLSGIKNVVVSLKNESQGVLWNGSHWLVGDPTWLSATGAQPWKFMFDTTNLSTAIYSVTAISFDSAGNKSMMIVDTINYAVAPVNTMNVTMRNIGDSSISLAWKVDTTLRFMKNVVYGIQYGAVPDSARATVFRYADTSFVLSRVTKAGLWYIATALVDSTGNKSPWRIDSVDIANTPPALAAINDTSIAEGSPWQGRLSAMDRNGDTLRYGVKTQPIGFSVDSISGAMSWTPEYPAMGKNTIVALASDGHGGVATDTFIITVLALPPQVSYGGDSIAHEDAFFAARISVSAISASDSAAIAQTILPPWMHWSRDSLFGTPGDSDVGKDTLTVIAINKAGLSDTLHKTIIVLHTNHPPKLLSWTRPDSIYVLNTVSGVLTVVDIDKGDSLSITWLVKPDWLAATATDVSLPQRRFALTGVAAMKDAGWVRFSFMVKDAAGATLSVRDSIYCIGRPYTNIKKELRQISFGAAQYKVSGSSMSDSIVSFEATLRGIDDTSFIMTKKNSSGIFGLYPLPDGRYIFTAQAIDTKNLRDPQPPRDTFAVSGATRHVFTDTSWTMLSIPSVNLSTSAVAGKGHVLHWDESGGEEDIYRYYRGESAIVQTTPGLSYWRRSPDTLAIILNPRDIHDTMINIRLSKGAYGWNQISSPYPYAVKWPLSAEAWKWNDSTRDYEPADGVLQPWRGYWVMADSTSVVRIDNTPVFANAALGKSHTAYFENAGEWRIRALFKSKSGNDRNTVMGFSSGAKDGFDPNDKPKPPRFVNSSYAYLWHSEWKQPVMEFASDIRRRMANINVFQIGIAPVEGKADDARISFEGVNNCTSIFFFLADRNSITPIETGKEYEIEHSAVALYKTVFVSADRNFLKNYPMRFAMAMPYPNPCRPMANIKYVLPYRFDKNGLLNMEPYAVKLALYDVMGRQIRQLAYRAQKPGFYHVVWDGKNASGRIAASGAYFCAIEAGEYSAINRLIMMR